MRAFPSFLTVLTLAVGVGVVPADVAVAEYVTLEGTEITQGQMRIPEAERSRIENERGEATIVPRPDADRMVLKETRVSAEISGVLARVRVAQVFQNPYPDRLEALYVFPLPEDAAVDGYSFEFDETVVEGVVKKKAEARREYERARDEGRKGALLEEERDNVFSQSVANIPPNGEIVVRIEYVHPVRIDGTSCTFRFPTVVAPRYTPGAPVARPNVGRGWSRDTDQVPDASRISPPILPAGMRLGNDVFIELSIDAGMPIQGVTAVTHELDVQRTTETTVGVRLKNGPTIANKDFVVEYEIAGEHSVLASLVHRPKDSPHGYVALLLQPKRDVAEAELTPREVVFVLDRSGSMRGAPISQLRILAQHMLAALNPQDAFRIVAFSSETREFHPDALAATPENIAAAQQFVRGLRSGSGTEMLPALKAALKSGRGEEARPRYLVLLSDALVGNDDRILGYLNKRVFDNTRVFPVAIGAAPNDYLIRRAAEIGRGFSMYVTNSDNAVEMAKRFNQKTSTPYMTDLELDWGELDVELVSPDPLPDLHADEPLLVTARYAKSGRSKIGLRGNLAGRKVELELELELPAEAAQHDSLGSIWARRRIAQIWNRNLGNETSKAEDEITRLGVEHQLVTRYTSFVAVEKERSGDAGGRLTTESVPVLLPEGMGEGVAAAPAGSPQVAPPAGSPSSPAPPPSRVRPANASTPPTVVARPPAPRPSAPVRSRPRGGYGGSVEWVFLLGLALLCGARALRSPGRKRAVGA